MNIAITQIGSALNEGGISVFIFELSNALIRDGHKVYLISGREVPKTETALKAMFDVENLPIIIPLQRKLTETYSLKLDVEMVKELLLWLFQGSHLLKNIAPDMIIINGAIPICSSTFKVAVCHDLEFRARIGPYVLQKLYDKAIYQMFDKVAATSTELAKLASNQLGIKSKKITTIPTCIDTCKYSVLPYEQREHAILHVGTWIDKNMQTTIKAFCRLAKTDHALKLYIVGDLWKWPKSILCKVKEEFSKRIYCVGKISKRELKNLYSRVKVTSVPSIYRVPVLSPTVLESLASGTPVVGGSTSISHDLLVDGYNGFTVYPTDINSLSERIALLNRNAELWKRFSANARSFAQNFDASAVGKRYLGLYNFYSVNFKERKTHRGKLYVEE
jgi:glycosyltransferase involved in cell wall biosynthesis